MNTDFRVSIIRTPLIYHRGDQYGTIPYLPTGIAYLAGYLEDHNVNVDIIDGFGQNPKNVFCYKPDEQLDAMGLSIDQIMGFISNQKLIGIAIHSSMSHSFGLELAIRIKKAFPEIVLVAGGHQATVTYTECLNAGFDYVVLSEGEYPFLELIECLRDGRQDQIAHIPGVAFEDRKNPTDFLNKNMDNLSKAAYHLLPLQNYWDLNMAHAPISGKKYLAVSTSRGCPYGCRFCTTPKLLGRKWRTRSVNNIVEELEYFVNRFEIQNFIIQDEIFGVDRKHTIALCKKLIEKNLALNLFLPSGVKVECFTEEVLQWLAKAGLRYLSLAPESGSPRILKRMAKPLDREKLISIASLCTRLNIKVGAFFIIGFEDEDRKDRILSRNLIKDLIQAGVEDISLFIWSPLPGADAFEYEKGWTQYEQLNWDPTWRKNYVIYKRFRYQMYIYWLLMRFRYHPFGLLRSMLNVFTGRYQLKCEMALARLLQSLVRPFLKTPSKAMCNPLRNS